MNVKQLFIYVEYFVLFNRVFSFDPISVASVGVGVLSKVLDFTKHNTICKFKECCTDQEIPADFTELQRTLEEKVYGQHIAKNVIVAGLKAHWNTPHAQKALTLSFHGWPGGGKNYVVKFIKDSLYKKGGESDHVHHFIGRIHFPLVEKVQEYQDNLYEWIKGNVTKCPRQLFIFDEVDKIPPTVLNSIKPMIDYTESVEKVNYKESIFIFLSNTGSTLIMNHYLKLWKSGVKREDVKLRDFEKLITEGAFNEEGGFHHSDTIKSNLIDHYIPFLPMEREHVYLCIKDQFKIRGIYYPSQSEMNEVLDFVEWGPYPENIFSNTGCKRLSQKVAVVVQQNLQ